MKKIFLFLAWCLCSFSIQARTLKFQIIPQPQHIEMHKGRGINYDEIRFILNKSQTQYPVLGSFLDALPRTEKPGKGVFLHIHTENVPDSPEGYVLTVQRDGIHISSKSSAGLFYGCQTLE